jgi:hypothetical protein
LRHCWRAKVPASPTKNRLFSIGNGRRPDVGNACVRLDTQCREAPRAAHGIATDNHAGICRETDMQIIEKEKEGNRIRSASNPGTSAPIIS